MTHSKHKFEDFLQQHIHDNEIVSVCRTQAELGTALGNRRRPHTSLQQLERKAGVGKTTISSVEDGATRMTVETIQKIARGLGLDLTFVLSKRDGKFNL